MILNLIKYSTYVLLLTQITSCQLSNKFNYSEKINKPDKTKSEELKTKETIEVKISCGNGNIKNFIKDGWKIKNEESYEKICSWKTIPANRSCDIEKDKGCKITKPDIVGKETIYLLEK